MDTMYGGFPERNTSRQDKNSLIHTLLFILPLAIVYEIGISSGALGGSINGADAIFRFLWHFFSNILGDIVSIIFFGLAIAGIIAAIVYQVVTKQEKIDFRRLGFSYLESIGWGSLVAIFLYFALSGHFPTFFAFEPSASVAKQAVAEGLISSWSKIVASIGAGIFEELLFRVVLLNVIFMFLTGKQNARSLEDDLPNFLKSAALSSIIFAIMHLGSVPASGLVSIFISSIALSFIYMKRGYAVVAGTHIVFDLLLIFGVLS